MSRRGGLSGKSRVVEFRRNLTHWGCGQKLGLPSSRSESRLLPSINHGQNCWPKSESKSRHHLIRAWSRISNNERSPRATFISDLVNTTLGFCFQLSPNSVIPVDAGRCSIAVKNRHGMMKPITQSDFVIGNDRPEANRNSTVPHVQPNGFIQTCVKISAIAVQARF